MAESAVALQSISTIPHWINGERQAGEPHGWGDVFNPAAGKVIARVPLASEADVDAAIAAAHAALPEWSRVPAPKRARIIFRLKELIERDAEQLAAAVTREHGKVLSDAMGSVKRGLEIVEFACGIPHLLKGEFSHQIGDGIDSHSLRLPVGVCAGITPFNFPAMVPMWMFPIALACGNTFVLKPSEKDPSCSLMLAELLAEAGLPAGVFNVVQGDKVAVDKLLTDPRVGAVSFVGSTPIAKYVYETGAAHGKRVQALGGAKNHMIVLPDADIEQAADALVGAAYGSAGERCMAISVAVAVGDAGDRLREKLVPKIKGLTVNDGTDQSAEMGPLVTREHRDKVQDYIDTGEQEGADLVVDGRQHPLRAKDEGFFLGPTLFDHAGRDMRIYKEEIFGPVLTMLRADSFEEALELVNAHEYGNGTAIFTRNGLAAREFAARVEAGMVGVNVPIPVPMAFHSFGGWKHSIFGDAAMHGVEGVRFYTRLKTITSRWPEGFGDGADLNMPVM